MRWRIRLAWTAAIAVGVMGAAAMIAVWCLARLLGYA